MDEIQHLFNLIKFNSKLLTLFFVVPEFNKKNKMHFHCLVVIKNIIDYNSTLKNNFINFLKKNYSLDVKVNVLNRFIDVKRWLVYMLKDINRDNKFKSYLYFLSKDQDMFGRILDIYEYYDIYSIETKGFSYSGFLSNLSGCKIVNNQLDKSIVVDLILYYILFNGLFVYKNILYKRVENTLISYELVGDVKDILYNNFQENVIMYFINNFPLHFKNFNFHYIIKKFLKTNENLIESIMDLTTNKIKPDYSILEFNDGLYFINFDKFIPKYKLKNYDLKVSTLKYYDKTFKHLSLPKKWIEDLKISLNIDKSENEKNNDKFKQLCLYVANIFNRSVNLFAKKRVLYIYGESNTRKTTLIAKPILSFFGKENVGFLAKSKNFQFQDLVDKRVGILDEFKYEHYYIQEYLKLFSGENVVVDEKYSKIHKQIKDLPIIILSNNKIDEKNENLKNALLNRIYEVEFKNVINNKRNININENVDKILKEEEPSIVVYCNKVYFDENFKKTKIKHDFLINSLDLGTKKIVPDI